MEYVSDFAVSCLVTIWPGFLILVTCIAIETVSPRTRYGLKDRLPGATLVLATPILSVPLAEPLRSFWKYLELQPVLDFTALPAALLIPYLVLSYDFINYWEHRFEHRFLWPIHAVHHSPVELHAANSYAHPLQAASLFLFHSLHISLIELDSYAMPMAVTFVMSVWGALIHSPTRVHLGPLRRIIVDERFHRIHHSIETRHFDKNFAPIFSIWDQLFGTAYFPASDEHPEVGVADIAPPRSILGFLLMPLRLIVSSMRRAKSSPTESVRPSAATAEPGSA